MFAPTSRESFCLDTPGSLVALGSTRQHCQQRSLVAQSGSIGSDLGDVLCCFVFSQGLKRLILYAWIHCATEIRVSNMCIPICMHKCVQSQLQVLKRLWLAPLPKVGNRPLCSQEVRVTPSDTTTLLPLHRLELQPQQSQKCRISGRVASVWPVLPITRFT